MTQTSVLITDPPFNAKCDGKADDTAAIQAAIDSLPADGGIVLFPPPPSNCFITSPLMLGNGTPSALSTRRGVILCGLGMPNTPSGAPFFNGQTPTAGPKITWGGGAWSTMILVNGPLHGWGIENLFLDGANVDELNGIQVISASFGDVRNLTIQNCRGNGIVSFSHPLSGYSSLDLSKADSVRNLWANVFVLVPATAGAKGILLNGASDGSTDTDYNEFHNVFIRSAGPAANFGLYLAVCDANTFFNFSASGFGGGGIGLQFDYTVSPNFPGSNLFYSYEIDYCANAGTPGPGATLNQFYGGILSNGARAPNLANTVVR